MGVYLFVCPPGDEAWAHGGTRRRNARHYARDSRGVDGPTPLMQRIALLVVAGTDGAYI